MEFDYIVKRKLYKGSEKVLAGFLELNSAKEYAERIDIDYLSGVLFFIDASEGKYVYGDTVRERSCWYPPKEQQHVLVYDPRKDRVLPFEETGYYPLEEASSIKARLQGRCTEAKDAG